MANALFNASSIKFLNSLQDNICTFKSKMRKDNEQEEASSVTLQVTLPSETTEQPCGNSLAVPIDIPGSYSHKSLENEALFASTDVGYQGSPLSGILDYQFSSCLNTDDLTINFDSLAVKSPSNSFHHGQQIPSPVQVGSPISPNQLYTNNFISSSYSSYTSNPYYPASPSFVGSPASHFVGSPAMHSQFLTEHASPSSFQLTCYLSPPPSAANTTKYQSPSVANSPSSASSYMLQQQFLFPPPNTFSRSASPVPDDVVLTTSEVNDYINSPNLSHSSLNGDIPISDFFQSPSVLNTTQTDDLELFPSVVQPASSPHTQPRLKNEQSKKTGRKGKIHQCPHCQHTSNRANNMKEHILIHDPNRPKSHVCKICSRAFARKHDMNRHYISCKRNQQKHGK
ncbi:hypothetical protein BD560DRAFT_402256 [Blakeslea trispora]|nr:hypothetical protein BD560DRAFT_402256 [Blakeslea trispora]